MSVFDKYQPVLALEEHSSELVTNPSLELYKTLESISVEANYIGNVSNYFQRKLINLGISIKSGFEYLTTWNYDPMETLNPSAMSSFVGTLDYLEMGKIIVPQPNGFKGELLPYTARLLQRTELMKEVIDTVIKPATARLGHYLANPVERSETRGFVFGVSTTIRLEDVLKKDREFFASNRQVTVMFNKLYSSLSEFVSCEQNMKETANAVSGGGVDGIRKSIKALVDITNALMSDIADNKLNETSKEFTKLLASELKVVAEWVEWYALTMTRIIETNNVLAETEKQLRTL